MSCYGFAFVWWEVCKICWFFARWTLNIAVTCRVQKLQTVTQAHCADEAEDGNFWKPWGHGRILNLTWSVFTRALVVGVLQTVCSRWSCCHLFVRAESARGGGSSWPLLWVSSSLLASLCSNWEESSNAASLTQSCGISGVRDFQLWLLNDECLSSGDEGGIDNAATWISVWVSCQWAAVLFQVVLGIIAKYEKFSSWTKAWTLLNLLALCCFTYHFL